MLSPDLTSLNMIYPMIAKTKKKRMSSMNTLRSPETDSMIVLKSWDRPL